MFVSTPLIVVHNLRFACFCHSRILIFQKAYISLSFELFEVVMANRKVAKVEEDQLSQGVAVIQSLLRTGKLQEALRVVANTQSSTAAGSDGAAMTDACKRRLEAEEVSEAGSFEHIDLDFIQEFTNRFGIDPALAAIHDPPRNFASQAPILPSATMAGYALDRPGVEGLPHGISSVSHWGKVYCELPKVIKEFGGPHAYEDLVAMAETQVAVRNYLQWSLTYNGTSSRTKDLANYLRASGYVNANPTYFPGSTDVRRFK